MYVLAFLSSRGINFGLQLNPISFCIYVNSNTAHMILSDIDVLQNCIKYIFKYKIYIILYHIILQNKKYVSYIRNKLYIQINYARKILN